jgi:3D (Asp-Asp-Asp) domain-containing protein
MLIITMKKTVYLFCLLTFILPVSACASLTTTTGGCSNNWKVTGYYTPVETDFDTSLHTVVLARGESVQVDERFLREVKMEGWGRTRHGWYLGYYDGQWHKSTAPKNAFGSRLKVGMVAVSEKYLPMNSKIQLADIQTVLGVPYFMALDRGGGVKNRHIDVYTGEGEQAKRLTWLVTGKRELCVL